MQAGSIEENNEEKTCNCPCYMDGSDSLFELYIFITNFVNVYHGRIILYRTLFSKCCFVIVDLISRERDAAVFGFVLALECW